MSAEHILQQQLHDLYNDHHGWLYGWLRKRLGCSHHAADVAQDTFLRLIIARNALIGIHEPRAYLTTTAKRLIIDHARRKLIEQAYLAELELLAETMPSFHSPEDTMIALQALEVISVVLEGISVKARKAFLLHYLEGQTHAAIASQLGVSTKMVQKYLIQALARCANSAIYH